MATTPREWPNQAKDARDRAAEAANNGLYWLVPMLDQQPMTEAERIRRIGIAISDFHTIARLLESVGAQTRP
jgi:hypothetical protein